MSFTGFAFWGLLLVIVGAVIWAFVHEKQIKLDDCEENNQQLKVRLSNLTALLKSGIAKVKRSR